MKGFIIACVATLMFNSSVNTMVDVNETKKSADKIEQAITTEKDKDEKASEASEPNVSEEKTIENNGGSTTTNNYNGNYYNGNYYNGDHYDGCTIIGDSDNNRTSLPDDDTVTNYNLCPRCNEYTLRMIYNEDKPEYSFWYCDDCEFCLK